MTRDAFFLGQSSGHCIFSLLFYEKREEAEQDFKERLTLEVD